MPDSAMTPSEKSVLQGRSALVTGGGRGIGRSVALLLARQGVMVFVVARTAEAVTQVAQEIEAAGGRSQAIVADVARYDDLQRVFAEIERLVGGCDILINNAAVLTMGPLVQSDPQEWIHTIQVNLFGAYFCSRLALPSMLAHGWGRILNVSSFAGSGPSRPNGSAYASSKAALDRLTLSLCAEVRDTGVTCNAIYPGDTDTQMQTQIRNSSAEVLGEQELAYFRNRYSRGELYDPLVPATLIMALLVSELNGEIINLDDDRGMNLVRNYTP